MGFDQQSLNIYFANHWHSRLQEYELSGLALVDKVKSNETVLDIGCGKNPFKGRINNLVGIDPAFSEADVKCTLEQFTSLTQFDVIFCLGSINFDSKEHIKKQIEKIVSLLKVGGRIYWRCNPGLHDHGNKEFEKIAVYPWTLNDHREFAKEFSCTVLELAWDRRIIDNQQRIYAEWRKD